MENTINNEKYLDAVKSFKPIAVIPPREEDERYGWGSAEMDARADEIIWEPALGDEWHCIPVGRGLIMSKAMAEKAAKEIADALKVALNA